jgi:hypothetical protein
MKEVLSIPFNRKHITTNGVASFAKAKDGCNAA